MSVHMRNGLQDPCFFNSSASIPQLSLCISEDEAFDCRESNRVSNDDVSVGLLGVGNKGCSSSMREEEEKMPLCKTASTKLCSRGHWRPGEDAKLRELVYLYGPQNWNSIAENLEGRSGKSCRLRWFNQLDPRINKNVFTEEEEERLLSAHRLYGNKWAMISRLFPGRTDNAVKNHWHVIMARKHREHSHIYRRKKFPYSSPSSSKVISMEIDLHQTYSESTTSINESASTCTDLSLTPSSTKPPPLSVRLLPSLTPHLGSSSAWEKRMAIGRSGSDRFHDNNANGCCPATELRLIGTLMAASQSVLSDSNSEVSATESVATNSNTTDSRSPSSGDNAKMRLPFFDFLGLGVRVS